MPAAGSNTKATNRRSSINRGTANRGSGNRGFGKHVSPATAERIRARQLQFSRELGEAFKEEAAAEKALPPQPVAPKPPKLKPEPISDEVLEYAMDTPYTFASYIGTEAFRVERGHVLLDKHDRKRLVVTVDQYGDIFYLDKTGAWFQTKEGFADDVWWGKVAKEVAEGTAAIYRLIRKEWEFIKGVLSTASWVYWVGVKAFDIMEFVGENRDKIEQWIKVYRIWDRASRMLLDHYPTLWHIFHDYLEETIWQQTYFAVDENNLSRRFGVFTGNLVKSAAKGKFSITTPIWEFIKGYYVARFAAIPNAVKMILAEAKNPLVLSEHLLSIGLKITPDVAQKIKTEYENNPILLHEILELVNEIEEILSSD